MQAMARMLLTRRSYRRTLYAVVTMQKCAQGMLSRIELRRQNRAASVIQTNFRLYVVRNAQEDAQVRCNPYIQQTKAAIRLQGWWHTQLGVRRYAELRDQVDMIQGYMRGYLMLRMQRRRARAIQALQVSLVRPWVARMRIAKRISALVVLQTSFRRVIKKLRVARMRIAAVRLQAWARSA